MKSEPKPIPEIKCPQCGKLYIPKAEDLVCCSLECLKKWYLND